MNNINIYVNYVQTYQNEREKAHAIRVSKLCQKMAKKDKKLAQIIGLLHNLCKFKGKDEILVTINTIKKGQVLDLFSLTNQEKQVVYNVLANFDKNVLTEQEKVLQAILFDSNLLDELYMLSKDNRGCLMELSSSVVDKFWKNVLISNSLVKNYNDYILQVLNKVRFINFTVTKDIIKKKELIDDVYWHLEKKDIIKPYYEYLKKII